MDPRKVTVSPTSPPAPPPQQAQQSQPQAAQAPAQPAQPAQADAAVSVKERTQRFQRLASESDLLRVAAPAPSNALTGRRDPSSVSARMLPLHELAGLKLSFTLIVFYKYILLNTG
ncbi:Protein of unknown function [Gryllus bimaculatus]|nr:Protein of unknown function [Gryllus bimaculatus]